MLKQFPLQLCETGTTELMMQLIADDETTDDDAKSVFCVEAC